MAPFPHPSTRLLAALAWIAVPLLLLAALTPPERASAIGGGLNQPLNIACLPFAQGEITEYNGNAVAGPYTSDATQTFITWRDESDSEDAYHVFRQIGNAGEWEEIAQLPADTTYYLTTGLDESEVYRYRVRASEGNTNSPFSDTCQKPLFLDDSEDRFRVFYRDFSTTYCPDVEDLEGILEPMCATQDTAERISDMLVAARDGIMALCVPGADPPICLDDPISDPPLPVDLTLCDGAGCARSIDGTSFVALRPSSMVTPFDPSTGAGQDSLKVPWHELFHKIQRGLEDPARKWVSEGQARASEDHFCLDPPTCDLMVDNLADSAFYWQVNDYLTDPNINLVGAEYGTNVDDVGYRAVLFWAYLMEQYGTIEQEPERGIDILVQFWESAQTIEHTHGIEVVNHALAQLHGEDAPTFHEVFKDFVVANYAKDIPNAPSQYRYEDEAQPPGSYGLVKRTVDEPLALGDQYIADPVDAEVEPWGARYYRFEPDSAVPTVAIHSETYTGNDLYYALLAVRGGDIVEERHYTGDQFSETLANDAFDEIVLVVAGLDQGSTYTLAVNATQPELRVIDPIAGRPAQAGDPAMPEKIHVRVQVLSPDDGAPLSGLDLSSFSITVGGSAVVASDIIQSLYVQGTYWYVVRAPSQSGTGLFDLTVENDSIVAGATLSDTEADAVEYSAAIETDNMVVGDRSLSMEDYGKMDAAQDAARLYVDSWEEGDQIGILSYNQDATLDLALQPWTMESRDDALDAIDAWTPDGNTGIGLALLEGLDEFDNEGSSNPWHMILLSDGMETVDEPSLQDFVDEYAARVAASEDVPQIHVVALGADADQDAMQKLADETSGLYLYLGEPVGARAEPAGESILNNELAELYRVVAEHASLEQQVYAAHGSLPEGPEEHIHTIRVDGSAREAIFAFNYVDTGQTETIFELRRPDNVLVPPTRIDGERHLLYRVPLPMQGEWEFRIAYEPPGLASESRGGGSLDYLIEASLRADLTMDLFLGLAPEERWVGEPMPILVSLSDSQPLPGAVVQGAITSPYGNHYELTLHDDGLHGDGAAGDGFYGGTFYHTHQPGGYILVVDAAGDSPLHGEFTRRARASFFMRGGEDSDGDGLPDFWEEEHGGDPGVYDYHLDPDGDGLMNLNEFWEGTHPLDPDTDNGGEGDGSEVGGHGDPHNPADDGVQPPQSVPWAGSGQLWLTLSLKSNYDHLRILRSEGPDGPWTTIADDVAPETAWRDGDVTNGVEYCYQIVAVSFRGAESATTNLTCATPRADPIAPEGHVTVSSSTARATALGVQLSLRASDAPQGAHYLDENDPPTYEGAHISGVSEMMISNRPDFAGAAWEPYQQHKPWTLEPRGNVATVYVRFRDEAGNVSATTADSIVVSQGHPLFLPFTGR